MKKTLALVLALLVAFSMFSVATFAAEDLVTIRFLDSDSKELEVVHVAPGSNLLAYVPENPVKADTKTTRYTFAGWQSSHDNEVYFANTIPDAIEGINVDYTATYKEDNISENQTLLNFIQSIFARINLIFQYFAEIFRFD